MIAHSIPPTTITTHSSIIFVDLDETLIKTDLLAEALVKGVKQCPLNVLQCLPALLIGRAKFKTAVAEIISPDSSLLPYRQDVIEFLQQQRDEGVKVVLATASPRKWAEAVATHLGLFDDVLASDGTQNLKGTNKLDAIRRYASEHQHSAWAYVGDCDADLPIFAAANQAYLVTSSKAIERRVRNVLASRLSVIGQSPGSWRVVFKGMRPHQWVKNVLVFIPMLLAHAFIVSQTASAILAWLCFSLVASAVYLLNDMLDVEADRRHPKKCHRPFASAELSLASGIPLVIALCGLGFLTAVATLPLKFVLLLAVYLALTTLYSTYLKNKLILDVMVLAGLYTLRVIAGGAAVEVPVSEWLMAFSIFLFTSLAFAKRYAELNRLRHEAASRRSIDFELTMSHTAFNDRTHQIDLVGSTKMHGRSYRVEDIGLIESLGPTSGYLSVLVLAMYISGPQVSALYRQGWMLWYVCPLLMYWVTRLWFVAKRGKLSEDPIVFALRDRVSLLNGLLVGVIMLVAIVS